MGTINVIVGFGGLILRSIQNYSITEALPNNELAAEFAENAGEELIGTLSDRIKTKVNKLFSKEPTMQEKLNAIVESVFNQVNEKHGDKFTGFPDYVEKKNLNIKTKSDMLRHIKIWANGKPSVSTITQNDMNDFVNEFYQGVSACIDSDEALKAHIATIRTAEGIKLLMAEMEELKRDIANMSVQQNIDIDFIELAETTLKELLDSIPTRGENRIDIKGDENNVKNVQQIGGNGSNTLEIKGNNCRVEDVLQMDMYNENAKNRTMKIKGI